MDHFADSRPFFSSSAFLPNPPTLTTLASLLRAQLTSTLCSNAYLNRSVRTGFSVRTSLITSIYNKTLKLSQAARAEFTAGKTVNLMAVDASRLDSAAWQLHSLWAAPMTVCSRDERSEARRGEARTGEDRVLLGHQRLNVLLSTPFWTGHCRDESAYCSTWAVGTGWHGFARESLPRALDLLPSLVPISLTPNQPLAPRFVRLSPRFARRAQLTLLPLQALLMRHLMGLRRQTNQLTDKRVRMTQETIAGIRVVKLLGWEQAMESHLGQVRTEELVNVRTIGNWRAYMTGITFIQPILASVLTFVVYSLTGHPLSPPIVFSSIALFNTLRMPLMMLPMVITNTTDAWVSLQRIKAMLLAPELGGDMVGRPEEKGKVELKDGEFEWEPPVKVLPDAPKGKRGAGRGGPSGGPNSTTMTARSGVTASAAAAASAEASGLQHTMRRGAYGATITPFSTTNQDQGISGWMRRTFRTTPTRGGVPPSATEMAAKRAVRAVGEPKVPAIDAVPFTGLHSMNLTVLPGELLAIVGRVGSGKSSLLSALVGEMKRTRGTGGIGGTVSFCPQSPWIQNATLRDNVLFGLPFDETKYWNAIRCAALERDLEILPDGDATEIGERGITLSGGQKARVSLARAVYADTDVVLLDDPLSAVDANVGRHLFEKCITGVLVSKTRILVTHQIHVLPGCDRIICLDNGTIVQQGTYAELMVDKEGYLNKIMTEYGGAGDADADDSSEGGASSSEDATTAAGESAPAGEVKGEFGKSAAAGGGSGKDKAAAGKGVGAPPGGGGSNPTTTTGKALMTVEERNAGAVKAGIYWKWIKFAGGIWFLTSVLFLLLAMQGTKVGTDTWLAQWSVNAYPNLTLATYMTVYVVLGILQGFCAVGFGLLLSFQGRLASKRMHETALGHVLHAPTSFFDQTPVGRIMNRFSKDIDAMDNTLPETWRMFLMTVSTTISTLVLISIVQPIFIAVMVPLMVVYYFAQAYYRSTARELKRLDSISRSPLFANFGETLTGLSTIRAFNASARFVKKNLAMLNYNNRAYYITLMIPRWLSIRLESISACLVFTISMLAVGTASPTAQAGLLSLAVTYSLQLTATMNWLTRQASETEVQMNGVERLLYYVDELEQEAPAEIPETKPAPTWPSKGEIDFKNLVVRYRPDLPAVLCGINVSVKPGERVGIVGRTGAGKSTIMTSLFRLVEASEGSIVIDGVDIGKIGLHDVRSKLSIIPQDPILFSGTVRYNLDPFSEFSDADIWDCLTRAGDMASVISGLPEKLEAPVAENGDNFSIGQRSLLCLARAMLRQSRIVVLDEATASVDMATDELIQKTIRTDERFKGRTILTIAQWVLKSAGPVEGRGS